MGIRSPKFFDEFEDALLCVGQHEGQPRFDACLRKLKGFHCVADPSVEAHANAPGADHVSPIAEHFKSHFTGGDQEQDFFAWVGLGDFEHFLADVVDGGDEKGANKVLMKR